MASLPSSKPDPMPHGIQPMLATLVENPFDRNGWVYEMKWDGYRAIAEVENGKVRLYSRNQLSFESKFPAIVQDLKQLPGRLILDGEIVALDEQGRPSFQQLQNAADQANQSNLFYYVFDLLWLDGWDLRSRPLLERKERLKSLLPGLPRVRYCDHIEKEGRRFFELLRAQGLEGMMAKDGGSPYWTGKRSRAWLKVKIHQRQEAIICGYTAPRGGRKELGALILGAYEGNTLCYIGHTGTGMDSRTLQDLKARLAPLETANCHFSRIPATNEKPTWTQPVLVCEVKFTEWTGDGHMRHPVYLGLRVDKPATEVTLREATLEKQPPEQPLERIEAREKSESDFSRASATIRLGRAKIIVSHPDKVFWPEKGYRKKDMIRYYRELAPYLLPYLRDRPFVLHRFPHGAAGASFYHKDQTGKLPEWVETVEIYSESNRKNLRYLMCNNEETLVYVANLGCIEMNPWNARVANLDRPDWMVIDLDPVEIGFDRVIEAALVVHAILEKAGAKHYCKTSGATGLHIYVPMGAQYADRTVREFGRLIAELAHQKLPESTSLERKPAKRQGKIYLDYLQNRRGQTLVAPYSLRPTPQATVSTPLLWEEVNLDLDPTAFTLENTLPRLKAMGDLWKPVTEQGIDLQATVEALGLLHSNPTQTTVANAT